MAVYLATQNPKIEVEKLTRFALGLFWKASVHAWRGDTTDPRIDLGPYAEEIRKWLRGQNAFPEHVYLIVVMEKPLIRMKVCAWDDGRTSSMFQECSS